MGRRDPLNEEHWRHSRPGRHTRWDSDLHATYGGQGWQWALGRKGWQTREASYVTRRHGDLLPPKAGRALMDADADAQAPPQSTTETPTWCDW